MTMEPIEGRPVIDYPNDWEYRLIGRSEEDILSAVATVLGDAPHTLEPGNSSKQGRYISMSLTTTVKTEDHRNALFKLFKDHESIVMVI